MLNRPKFYLGTRMRLHLTYGVLILLSSSTAFWGGTRVGVEQFQLAESQYRASIAVHELEWLAAGDLERLQMVREISINAWLAQHGRYLDSNFKWLWPELRAADDDAIKRAVSYRLDNPYDMPEVGPDLTATGADAAFVEKLEQLQKRAQQDMNRVLDLYAEGEHR